MSALPPKLYNYLPVKYLAGALQHNHLHCSSPENFNDPWDCKPSFNDEVIANPVDRQKWIAFFEQMAAPSPLHGQQLYIPLPPSWETKDEVLRQFINSTTEHSARTTAKNYRIFCLSPQATLLLMWAHYGDRHKGICLEFDTTSKEISRARKVKYEDKLPLVSPDDILKPERLVELMLLTKSNDWSYEEEYRLLARNEPTFSLPTTDDFLQLSPGAITAVVAGCRADLTAIREIIRENAPNTPLKLAVQQRNAYHLDIITDPS